MPVRFTQSCPTCGRRIQIRAALVGYTVSCQHCSAEFIAKADSDNDINEATPMASEQLDPLMVRVEEALKRASSHSPVV